MDTRSLTRPRHVLTSLVLCLLLSGAGAGLVGYANAGADTEAASLGQGFSVAAPNSGDRGVYRLVKAELDDEARQRGFEENREFIFDFTIGAPSIILLGDGQMHGVVDVDVWSYERRGEWDREDEETHFYDGHGVVAVASVSRNDGDRPPRPALLPVFNSSLNETTTWNSIWFHLQGDLPCSVFHPFQGRLVEPLATVHDAELGCGGMGTERDPNRWHQRMVLETDGEVDYLRVSYFVTHPDNVPRESALPDLEYWFREGTPYPVRILDVRGGLVGAPGDVLALAEFERGLEPLVIPVDVPAVPQVGLAPLTVTGPDDAGVDAPLRLSDAFEAARTDAQYAELREYLDRHPDARVMSARHAAFDMEGTHTERWRFFVTDGVGGVLVETTLSHRYGGFNGDPLPVATEPSFSAQTVDGDGGVWGNEFPPIRDLPAMGLRMADVQALWLVAMADQKHADASFGYDFQYLCDEDCRNPFVRISAGQTYYYRSADPLYPVVDSRDDVWLLASMEYEGEALRAMGWSEQRAERRESLGAAPDESPATQAKPTVAPSSIPAWSAPTAAQAATVAGGAAFIALLYYLSPLAKGGLGVLFSRVRGDALLENPLRRTILDLLESDPGLHFQEIVRRLGRANGTVEHHVRKLVEGGHVKAIEGPGYTCYFPAGAVDHRVMAAAPMLRSEAAKAILKAVGEAPGIGPKAIADAAGISPATVTYHVHRLEQAGLLESARAGGKVQLNPTGVGLKAAQLA